MAVLEGSFEAPLWTWRDGTWMFVTLPHELSDRIDDAVSRKAGFGSVKVTATIGAMTWSTSVFPSKEEEAFVLPVKKAVRVNNGVGEGDTVLVHVEVAV
jgi:hypothetical protein